MLLFIWSYYHKNMYFSSPLTTGFNQLGCMSSILNRQSKLPAILLLLPLIYLVLSFFYLQGLSPFHFSGDDPVYPYLFNSLNLAGAHWEVGIYEHPGMTVDVMGGVLIKMIHIIRHNDLPIDQDVILNPEAYLHSCSLVLIGLFTLITYLTGYYIYKNTGNKTLSFIFQLAPFLNAELFENSLILMPESLIVLASLFFSAFIYFNTIEAYQTESGKWRKKTVLIMGIFIGFLVATKYVCAPSVFLVLFVLKNSWQRIFFVICTFFSFLLGVIPGIRQFNRSLTWITNLFTHDGAYGSGKKQVIDAATFIENLKEVFTHDIVFTSVYLFLTGALILIARKKLLANNANKALLRLAGGLWVSTTLLILFVAKHYSSHYLIPAEIFFSLALVVSWLTLFPSFKFDSITQKQRVIVATGGGLIIGLLAFQQISYAGTFLARKASMTEACNIIKKQKGIPVISCRANRSASVQASISFGFEWAGSLHYKYYAFAKEQYPNSYYYHQDLKMIDYWQEEVMILEILAKNPKVMVYDIADHPEAEKEMLQHFCMAGNTIRVARCEQIYSNTKTNEHIYLLESDTAIAAKQLIPKITATCDFETPLQEMDGPTTDGKFHNITTHTLSHKGSHSGTNSLLLTQAFPDGAEIEFAVSPGDFVNARVWRKAANHLGGISYDLCDGTGPVINSLVVCNHDSDGWEQISCRFRIPKNSLSKRLRLKLTYTLPGEALFDDFSILIYPEN